MEAMSKKNSTILKIFGSVAESIAKWAQIMTDFSKQERVVKNSVEKEGMTFFSNSISLNYFELE